LQELGLSDNQIDALAHELDCELSREGDPKEPIGTSVTATYCSNINVARVANRAGLEPQVVHAAIRVIAPLIARSHDRFV
jgi:hypothetical protein